MADQAVLQRRRLLLLALAANFPNPVAKAMLELTARPYYVSAEADFPRDLAYLEARKLIARKTDLVGGRSIVSYACTADGVNVSEDAATDPGVAPGREE